MANRGKQPGDTDSEPIESRRAPAAPEVGSVSNDEIVTEDGEGSVLDVPDFGAFSAEAARPTPLDDIAEVERQKAPRD